uniref:Uncharacterized protein n=1 Tax=Anguilla anguilla TaxID=7936 RepID=A0A0E9TK96_ANGAN
MDTKASQLCENLLIFGNRSSGLPMNFKI